MSPMLPDPADLINTILAAIRRRLPYATTTLTAENGATIDVRLLLECDIDAMCGRIAADVARVLAHHAIDPEAPDDPRWTGGSLRELADQLDTQEANRG